MFFIVIFVINVIFNSDSILFFCSCSAGSTGICKSGLSVQ